MDCEKVGKKHAQNSGICLSDSIFDLIDIFSLIYLRKGVY